MARVSLEVWAKMAGISRATAYKRAKTGKITVGRDGKVDPKVASEEWARNQNELQTQRSLAKRAVENIEPAPAPAAADRGEGRTLGDAQRAREWLRVRKDRMMLDKLEGKLVEVESVQRAIAERAIVEREALLNLPARIARTLAGALDLDERILQSHLDREMRAYLKERSSFTWPSQAQNS